jgi:hypothetical protein
MSSSHSIIAIGLSVLNLCGTAIAGVPKDLPYPTGSDLTGEQVAEQVYFVNHFYANKNYSVQKDGRKITVLLNKSKDQKPKTMTLLRYINNDYKDGNINARDMTLFQSGNLKGTGILITDFTDDNKSQSYAIWLPQLRKVKRFAKAGHNDSWGKSDFTSGDVTLRKPEHETHEILGKEKFNQCLGTMAIPKNYRSKYSKSLPGPKCIKNRDIYKLKSTTNFPSWWYDYRVSYVDAENFADHRTEYFKGGKMIKVIDRDWGSFGAADKRSQYWNYWYGKTLATGHETWMVVPEGITQRNSELGSDFWSTASMKQ